MIDSLVIKDYKKLCLECIPLVRKVGVFIHSQLGKVRPEEIETKDLNSLVSYVDKKAEEQLVEGLSDLWPGAGFITEEETVAQSNGNTVWIIDPLDGTSNFLHGIPHFSISVALMVGGTLRMGMVLDVVLDELYYAWEGGGAYLNDRPIHVSTTTSISDSLVATGFPYKVEDVRPLIRTLGYFMRYARGIRRFGSAALDIVYVACGRFDCYYETTLNAWDLAGGVFIVKEAGGTVSDFKGGDDYLFGKNLIVSNTRIHHDLQQIINSNFI